jgi:hypothetical protein
MPASELAALRCKCPLLAPLLCRPDDPRLGPHARCHSCRKPFVRDLAAGFGAAAWASCTDTTRMRTALGVLAIPIPVRKLRLAACWVCRNDFDWCRNPRFLEAVAVGEAFADGEATERDRQAAYKYVRDIPYQTYRGDEWWSMGLWCVAPERPQPREPDLRKLALPADWLREAFGNPFEAAPFDPEWRTSTAVALARSMLQRRDFDLFPYLADALQDAGCDDPRVRAHCESSRPHGRGCWLLDAVLGM